MAGELFTAIQVGVVEGQLKNDGTISATDAPGRFFEGATDFTLNYPTFVDNSQTNNYFVIGFPGDVDKTCKFDHY